MEEEATLIDEWLEQYKKTASVCTPKGFTIYFPRECPECPAALKQLTREVADIFGGVTEWDGDGCWIDRETKQKVCEPVRVIQVFHKCTDPKDRDKFTDALKFAGKRAKQTEVGIRGTDVFYSIRTDVLSPPKK